MKVALVTTLPSLIENSRIKEEIKALNYSFTLIDLSNFSFSVVGGNLSVKGLTDQEFDIIISRGIFSSIKPIIAVLQGLRKKGIKIFDNNFLHDQYLINKTSDLAKLALNNIPVPNTAQSRNFSDYKNLSSNLGFPLVIKSTRMGKGANVFKISNLNGLYRFIEDEENRGREAKNFILQEFIPYKYDLRVLIIGDRVFTMRRIPAKGEFRANFSLGGHVEKFDLDEDGLNLAKSALKAVGLEIGGVDLLITKDNKKYVLEVNHTAGFVGMEKAYNENIGKVFVEYAIANAR